MCALSLKERVNLFSPAPSVIYYLWLLLGMAWLRAHVLNLGILARWQHEMCKTYKSLTKSGNGVDLADFVRHTAHKKYTLSEPLALSYNPAAPALHRSLLRPSGAVASALSVSIDALSFCTDHLVQRYCLWSFVTANQSLRQTNPRNIYEQLKQRMRRNLTELQRSACTTDFRSLAHYSPD